MTTTQTISVPRLPVDAEPLGYFRFGRFGDGIIATNEFGEWHHFDDAEFREFLKGHVSPDDDAYAALSSKGFLRDGLDLDHVATAMRRRKKFVGLGPSQHVLDLGDHARGLSVETAKDIIDFAMLSTSGALTFQLTAHGVPNVDILGFLVQYSTEKNRYEGKTITHVLVANPADIDAELAQWLIDKRFKVRTRLAGSGLGAEAISGIGRLNEAAAAKKRQGWGVDVDVIVDADNAGSLPAIITELHSHGVRRFRLRPVLHGDKALPVADWASVHRGVVDVLLGLQGEPLVEELTAGLVSRISQTDPTADLELRSPSGVVTGQVVYDLDGRIFPSEAARGLEEADDYVIGVVGEVSYREAITHPTLRAMAMASLLECLPGFAHHWATPYIGVDPTVSLVTTGDLFATLPTSLEVGAQVAAVENVFRVLVGNDGARTEALLGWAS